MIQVFASFLEERFRTAAIAYHDFLADFDRLIVAAGLILDMVNASEEERWITIDVFGKQDTSMRRRDLFTRVLCPILMYMNMETTHSKSHMHAYRLIVARSLSALLFALSLANY